MEIQGRDERVYVGLSTPPLVGGVDFKLLILNIGLTGFVFILFGAGAWWWIGVTWVIHKLLKNLSKNDPFLRQTYIRYAQQADRYEPWPEQNPRRSLRPIGYGRGSL